MVIAGLAARSLEDAASLPQARRSRIGQDASLTG